MSREKLEQAHALIVRKAYAEAREILVDLQERSSTARRWLVQVDAILDAQDATDEAEERAAATPSTAPEPVATATVAADDTQIEPTSASGDHTLLSETFTHDARQRWEYREIVLRNWNQHLSNIDYALEQGESDKITVEDAYIQLLNENGAQGWEVIAEEILPQQYIRLLMKRPVS
jgi:hypothetical protein